MPRGDPCSETREARSSSTLWLPCLLLLLLPGVLEESGTANYKPRLLARAMLLHSQVTKHLRSHYLV